MLIAIIVVLGIVIVCLWFEKEDIKTDLKYAWQFKRAAENNFCIVNAENNRLNKIINSDDKLMHHLTLTHENERLVRANKELEERLAEITEAVNAEITES